MNPLEEIQNDAEPYWMQDIRRAQRAIDRARRNAHMSSIDVDSQTVLGSEEQQSETDVE